MNNPTGCPVGVEEGTRYKLQKKANNGLIYSLYWEIGYGFAHIFKYLRLSPNFVSFLSLISYVVMGYLFLNAYFAWGGIAFLFGVLMDCTDGKLARMTNKTSRLGIWLDYNFDNVRPLFLYPAIAMNLVFVIINMKWDDFSFSKENKESYVKNSRWHPILKQFYFYEGIEPLALLGFVFFGHIDWYLICWACGMTLMYLLMAFYGGFVINRKDKNEAQ